MRGVKLAVVRLAAGLLPSLRTCRSLHASGVEVLCTGDAAMDPDMKIFMSELLRTIPNFVSLDNSVVVLNNAPCHSGVEEVFLSEEFAGSCLLRLAPYSPMLNPIENVFSTFKASVRQYLRRERRALLTVPLGSTIRGHRAAMLERAADFSTTVISAALFWSCFRQTRQFYVTVMNLDDCGVGQ
ncbi:hypothetical protein AeRB84_013485 [Aphanomyces euteiches]|nr:hypothetical protein AeRB84_013485 [Aphanomyces euteiches]